MALGASSRAGSRTEAPKLRCCSRRCRRRYSSSCCRCGSTIMAGRPRSRSSPCCAVRPADAQARRACGAVARGFGHDFARRSADHRRDRGACGARLGVRPRAARSSPALTCTLFGGRRYSIWRRADRRICARLRRDVAGVARGARGRLRSALAGGVVPRSLARSTRAAGSRAARAACDAARSRPAAAPGPFATLDRWSYFYGTQCPRRTADLGSGARGR